MSDEKYKILGELEDETGRGIFGHNTATTGDAIGVEGRTDSSEGYGLYTPNDARVDGTLEAQRIAADQIEGGGRFPYVVVYQEEGTAYAVSESTQYSGEDILDVIQQAIDAAIDARNGFIHVVIEPGIYPVSNTLNITKKGPIAVSIESPSAYGAYLQTRGGPDGEGITVAEDEEKTVLEFNPEAGGTATDRAWGIEIRGITIDDRQGEANHEYSKAHPYTAGEKGDSEPRLDGLYINDCRHAIVDRFVARQFKTALRFENVWQGQVNYPVVVESGHTASESPAIQVIGGDTPESEFGWDDVDVDTQNANNHIQFNHLQGNASEYHFFQCRRARNTQCEINFANVELQGHDYPGFAFRGGGLKWIISDSFFKYGNPSIDVDGGSKLVVDGCYQEAGGQFLNVDTTGRVVLGDCSIESGAESGPDAISVKNCRLTASNLWVYGGKRAINIQVPQETVVSNCTFVRPREGAVRIGSPGRQQLLTNLVAREVGTSGYGYTITLANVSEDTILDDIIGANSSENSTDSVVDISGDDSKVHTGLVVPSNNVTQVLAPDN